MQTICSTHLAEAKRTDPYIVSTGKDWKRYQFPAILNEGVEEENLALRQKLGDLQEKIETHRYVHEAVRAQLDSLERHNQTLQKAFSQTSELAENWKAAYERATRNIGQRSEHDPKIVAGFNDVIQSPDDFEAGSYSGSRDATEKFIFGQLDKPVIEQYAGPTGIQPNFYVVEHFSSRKVHHH